MMLSASANPTQSDGGVSARQSRRAGQARSGKKIAISRAADSGESEPCTRFSRLDSDRSPRMVPGSRRAAVGGPVEAADDLDRLVALEHHRHERAGGDEGAQRRVAVLADVLGVVPVGQCRGRCVRRSSATMPRPLRSNRREHLAHQAAAHGVGLDQDEACARSRSPPRSVVAEPTERPDRPRAAACSRSTRRPRKIARNQRPAKRAPRKNIVGTTKPVADDQHLQHRPGGERPAAAQQPGEQHAGHQRRRCRPTTGRAVVDVAEVEGHQRSRRTPRCPRRPGPPRRCLSSSGCSCRSWCPPSFTEHRRAGRGHRATV